jgi:hypothetical protein
MVNMRKYEVVNQDDTAEAFVSPAQQHAKEAHSYIMSHKTAADGQCT